MFGRVWSVLYVLIFISFGYVFHAAATGKIPKEIALPFALNLLFNFAFSPIQFGLQSNVLATVDILLVVVTLVWALWAIYPHYPWVAYINIPYLLWGLFATGLQIWITLNN